MDRTIEWLRAQSTHLWDEALTILASPETYSQLGVVAVALCVSWFLSNTLKNRTQIFAQAPADDGLHDLRTRLYGWRDLLPSVVAAAVFGAATPVAEAVIGEAWLVRAAQGIAFVTLAVVIAGHFIGNASVNFMVRWVGVPVALLFMVGLLDETIAHLESVSFDVGNISISLYAVLRTFFFGAVLFWLGRVSNQTGQRIIRTRENFDVSTREVIAKLFEIAVFVVMFLLLMNVMGIDLTALAVFGGALGVGLGFGLQQIAANFISGLIILLDRTITIGDYIELEDGRSGTLRELTMRSATLATFDGKDIMVPNEQFITTAFVNWTHNNTKQRYSLHFQVAYDTDLEPMFEIIRRTCASHPKVLSGDDIPIEERPDAEIESFGDSGIDILVEFWMEGIDDGVNRVGGDLNMMIWTALRENGIQIPFPQREVRVLGEVRTTDKP
jgi:small-conductance mechanosensitive channel